MIKLTFQDHDAGFYILVFLSATMYSGFPNNVEKAAMMKAIPEATNSMTGAKIKYSIILKTL